MAFVSRLRFKKIWQQVKARARTRIFVLPQPTYHDDLTVRKIDTGRQLALVERRRAINTSCGQNEIGHLLINVNRDSKVDPSVKTLSRLI